MKKLSLIALMLFSVLTLAAQSIYPTPQSVEWGKGSFKFNKKSVKSSIDKTLPAEGYTLEVTNKGVKITAADKRGQFYAEQTLNQIVKDGMVNQVKIKDFPVVRFRGVVEGFYGKPWSHRDRLAQFVFYGQNKLNTYIYGPKDDPYHSSLSGHADGTNKDSKGGWRVPYPAAEAAKISELAKTAAANHVDFVWAIHPGQDIKWNDEDFENLKNKFNAMYDLGVRSFAVFFDDISGVGTDPHRQAQLLNRLNTEFVKVKGDVTPLIMCPTEYNKSWANPKMDDAYLPILGRELDKDIQIMWTGDRVCANITTETLDWINARIGRPTYIWWNFPVTDYVRHIVLQGPSYGLTKEAKGRMNGFTSNPMENAEASKIALFGVADYTWNPEHYNALLTWEEGIKRIMPQAAEAYRAFAIHSSDLEKNGHGYRRDESWETDVNNIDQLTKAYQGLITAADVIYKSGADEFLVAELQPWLDQGKVVGQIGLKTIHLKNTAAKGDARATWVAYLASEMTPEQLKAYGAHKVGTLKLMPWITATRDSIARAFYTSLEGSATANNNPKAKIYTNIERFKAQTVSDVANVISIAPIMERIAVDSSCYYGVEFPDVMTIEKIEVSQPGGNRLKREFSIDGHTWSEKATKARFVRFINIESKTQDIRLEKFRINVMPSDKNMSALTDGDLRSVYSLGSSLTLTVPEGATEVIVLGEEGARADIEGFCNAMPLLFEVQDIPAQTSTIEIKNSTGKIREIIWKIKK